MTTPTASDQKLAQEFEQLIAAARIQAKQVFAKLPALGAVAWLCSQSPRGREQSVGQFVDRCMAPIMLGQARVMYEDSDVPMAYASWAKLTAEISLKYARGGYELQPGEWASGGELWIIDWVAPYDSRTETIEEFCQLVLPGERVKFLEVIDGVAKVREIKTQRDPVNRVAAQPSIH
jgi:cytolysin-activating lysine-acyltransferase